MLTLKGILWVRKIGAALLVLALATPAIAAERRVPFTARESSVWSGLGPDRNIQFQALPLERSRQNHLLIRAQINGKPALLGVDSGAPVSAIATNRVAHFGLTPAKAGGDVPTRLRINGAYNNVVMARGLQLGALNLVDEPMVAIDLGGSRRAAKLMNEQAIDGILGADVLFPTHAVLDCRNQILILKVDPNVRGGVPGMNYAGYSRVPMSVSSGYNLYVDGSVNGKKAKLMVDTGAFATLLHQGFVRRMKIPLRDTPYSSAGVNLKQRGVQMAKISRLSVGSVHIRGKEVGVINLEGLIRNGLLEASPPVAGLLGSEILQRHNGIIDFGTKTLYLKL
ncbi:MAG TPA: aspartyl protease family protein [Chthoniobacterales bacterium]|nr:aspartyl protease family protein [Chthoniobacterales bacterium]